MARKALLLAALAVFLVTAGCLAGDDASDPPPPDGTDENATDTPRPELVPPSFETPVPVATTGAAEPAAIAAPDGTLYVLDFRQLYASTDAGATYEALETPFEDRGDSDLVVGPDGTLHYVGMGIDEDGPRLPYHRRAPNGTWEPVRELAPNSSSVDRQWLTRGANGTLVLTWNDFEASVNKARVSHDDGDTWGPVHDLPDPTAAFVSPPVVHGDTVLQAWKLSGEIALARSTDAGASWETVQGPEIVKDTVGFPVLAFDQAGTLYLAVAHDTRSSAASPETIRPQIHVFTSRDAGGSWSDFTRVDTSTVTAPSGTTSIFPWIVAGAPGRVAVAFYENPLGTPPESPTAQWYPTVSVSTTADRDDATWATVPLTEQPVKSGSICTRGTGCNQAGDWRFRDYFEMDLTPRGHPVVAFVRDTAPASPTSPPAGTGLSAVEVMATVATDGWTAWEAPATG